MGEGDEEKEATIKLRCHDDGVYVSLPDPDKLEPTLGAMVIVAGQVWDQMKKADCGACFCGALERLAMTANMQHRLSQLADAEQAEGETKH